MSLVGFLKYLVDFLRQDEIIEAHQCTVQGSESLSFLPPLKENPTWFQKLKRSIKKSTLISEENPESFEYFRSKAEIRTVRKQHVDSESFVIHPFSMFRAYYEIWMSFVWIAVIFYSPANAAFDMFNQIGHSDKNLSDDSHMRNHFTFNYYDFAIKMLCIADIIMTFLTGYPIKKRRKVVMNPIRIAKHYGVSLLFLTDLLASIPFNFMTANNTIRRRFHTFGFLRIIRLPTLYFYTSRTLDLIKIRSLYAEIFKNVIVNYLVFHWFACLHYMVPQARLLLNGEVLAESWVEKTDLPELSLGSRYISCLYRAVGSLLCITFEETNLEAREEQFIAMITFIFGKVYMFCLTVLILNYLLRQRSLEIKYYETISQVQAYMSQRQLPMSMQIRLLQFYDYRYNKKFFKERSITGLLSEKLKGEINLNICSQFVQNVELLSHLPQNLLEQVVVSLKPEIYLPNDIIIKAGSVGDCMYFLASGTVGVWTPSGKEVCHLQDGAHFGEISLVFKDKRRTANIIAVEICEVYKLDRRVFRNCFKTNSSLFKMLENIANERMEITQMYEDVHAKTFLELGHKYA